MATLYISLESPNGELEKAIIKHYDCDDEGHTMGNMYHMANLIGISDDYDFGANPSEDELNILNEKYENLIDQGYDYFEVYSKYDD